MFQAVYSNKGMYGEIINIYLFIYLSKYLSIYSLIYSVSKYDILAISHFRYVPFDPSGNVRLCCSECCSQCQDVLFGIQTSKMVTGMIVIFGILQVNY